MSYDNEFAKAAPQGVAETRNLWADFSVIPAFVYPVGVALVMALSGVNLLICAAIIAGAILYQNHLSKQEALKEARARAAAYANHCVPVVVSSTLPDELPEEVEKRAEVWRQNLRLSGNQYADQIPIIKMPFMPMLYHTGQLSTSWGKYRQLVAEMEYQELLKWHDKCPQEIKNTVGSQLIPPPASQPK